ncbi:MAG: hypothetical protein ABL911_00400 [Gallionella sp.]
MFRNLLPKILLIFALLFAQLGGLTHGITHVLAEQKQNSDQSLPHDKHCDLCVAYAQIGGAISSNSVGFFGSAGIEAFHVDHFSTAFSSRFVAFSARAPPYSA